MAQRKSLSVSRAVTKITSNYRNGEANAPQKQRMDPGGAPSEQEIVGDLPDRLISPQGRVQPAAGHVYDPDDIYASPEPTALGRYFIRVFHESHEF